ncbi:unnamed protein product [Calicophoron daubneyi]|uniref:SWIM-type domain-containing protein n=1 Tax=Calicophoron daubneyi TaxID=300641 RepID=A0AAV2TH72_CALDB
MVHNHAVDPRVMVLHPEFRILTEKERQEVAPFLMENCRTDRIKSFIQRRFGKRAISMDVCNLRRKYAAGGLPQNNWNELADYFRANGRVYVVGNLPNMTVFCFSTNGQIELLNRYPEVVGIDVTYRTTREGWYLCELLVVDGLGHGRAVLFAFMSSESSAQYVHVLRALRAMLNEGRVPCTFVVDKCTACMEAIREVFPMAETVICKFHVLRAVRRKAKGDDGICMWFRSLLDADSEEEINESLTALQRFSPAFYIYLERCWLSIKEKWCTYYMRALTYGCTTNNRVESAHRWLKQYFEHRYPLFKAVKLLWLYAQNIVSNHNDAVALSLLKYKDYGVSQQEQDLLNRMTTFAADVVYRAMNDSAVEKAGQISGSTVCTVNSVTGRVSTVDILQWTCDCHLFFAYRLPCPHIIAAAHSISYRVDVLPLRMRWLRSNSTHAHILSDNTEIFPIR